MRNKDTSSWEELLSECADSWELGDTYADGSRQLLEDGSVIGTIAMHISQHEEVVAAAPAAVAEAVRLRREIEDLLGTLSKATIDIARGDYEHGQHTAFLLAASQLTHILEGGTDE